MGEDTFNDLMALVSSPLDLHNGTPPAMNFNTTNITLQAREHVAQILSTSRVSPSNTATLFRIFDELKAGGMLEEEVYFDVWIYVGVLPGISPRDASALSRRHSAPVY